MDTMTKTRSAGRSILNIIIMIAFIVGITFLLRTFVFVPYEIPSGSMEKTIMTNDRVFSEKVSYYFRTPAKGDIVTFADPEVPGRTLIKRVIATEGQVVDIQDNSLYIDGVIQDEPYVLGKPTQQLSYVRPGFSLSFPYTVPKGHIWVMGDNRTASQDSRYFGSVPVSSVSGKAIVVYWPFNNIKFL